MVWGLIGGGLSALGGIGSSLLGAQSANQAAAYNYAAAQENARRADQERFAQQLQADRVFNAQTAPVVDARGNRTEYIPGLGWITTPSETTEGLILATDEEQRRRLIDDTAQMRRGLDENERDRIQEGSLADEYMRRLRQPQSIDRTELEGILLQRQLSGINDAFDDARQQAATTSLRTGSPASQLTGDLTRQQADATASAALEAALQARSASQQERQAEEAQNANIYNMLASRASNVQSVPFTPTQIPTELASGSASQRAGSSNAGMALISSAGRQGGRFAPMEPNYGNALALGSSLDALGGFTNQIAAQQQYNQLVDALTNRQLGNTGTGAF